jgi:predicted nuclease with TOPRIM domain
LSIIRLIHQGLLEKSLEENQKLSKLLESREQEIAALKAQLERAASETSRLEEENAALIKAMGSLSN